MKKNYIKQVELTLSILFFLLLAQHSFANFITINEINYRNVNLQEDIKFIELHNSSSSAINISGWTITGGVSYSFPSGTQINSGGYLVIAQDPSTCQSFFSISNVLGPLTGNLSTGGDEVILRNNLFEAIDNVDYESWDEWPNVRFNDDTLKHEASIQKINPQLDGKHGGSWSAATPSPGTSNSAVYSSNWSGTPVIKNVSMSPKSPITGDEVRIKADFDDHLNYSSILTVKLEYQVVTPGNYIAKSDATYLSNWTTISMLDNGLNADSTANNGVYTAKIPASNQVHRNFIRYRVKVTTTNGYSSYYPDPNHPESNYAYYVYDGYPTFNGYNLSTLDSLQDITILTKSSTAITYIGNGGDNAGQYTGTEYLGEGTLVYNGKIFDHIRFRPRGGDSRFKRKKPGIKIDLNSEKKAKALDDCGDDYNEKRGKLALSGTWSNDIAAHGLTESLIYKVLELCDAPFYRNTDYTQLRIVDQSTEAGNTGDFWGVFLIIEDYGGDHLEEHNHPEGNIWRYKPVRMKYLGDFPNSENIGPIDLTNIDQTAAINDRVGSIIYGQNGNNYIGKHSQRNYYNSESGEWFCWWGDKDNAFGSPFDDVTVFPRAQSIPTTICKNNLIIESANIIQYKNELRSAYDLLLSTEQIEHLVDNESAKIYDPNASYDWTVLDKSRWAQTYDLGTIDAQIQWYETWFQDRAAHVASTTNTTVDGIHDVNIPNKPTINLTGSTALDNLTFSNSAFSDPQGSGTFAALEWRVGEWSDPANTVYQDKCPKYEIETKWESGEITSFSSSYTISPDAQLKVGRTYKIRVRYKDNTGRWSHWSDPEQIVTTPAVNYIPPSIVINEIMYNPEIGCGSPFIEIHNTESFAVSLNNFKFSEGIDYDFPTGTSIAANGYLVLAKDSLEFVQKYGFSPFGDFGSSLSKDGEKIILQAPYRTIVDSLTYNDKNPWDEDPDGYGPSLELLNPSSDNTDPLNWFRSDNACGTPNAVNSRVCTGTAESIVINEINYNSNNTVADPGDWIELHNQTGSSIDISDWTFYDNNNGYVLPQGTIIGAGEFLVLAENDSLFSNVFPNVDATYYQGNFNFGLSNKGERISLFDENKCLSDHVIFDDTQPWPTAPDGTGPTLSLITPNLDNALHSSWESSSNISAAFGTPGRANVPCPTVSFTVPPTICKDSSVVFTATSSSNVDYTWTIQGGTPASATTATVNASFPNPGFALIGLEATYYECTTNLSQLSIIESCNAPPIPQPDNYLVNEDKTLTKNVLTNDTEPDGQPMTTTLVSGVSNGNLTLNSNGSFTYTPNANYFGSDGFTYQVCDNASPTLCATESVSITVNPINDAPITNSDLFSGNEDTQITGNLLNNDSDIEGHTLSATVSTSPTNGTVVIQPNGSFTYTPNTNYFGSDQFVYQVCDNGSPTLCVTENVTISISPENDAPIATADNLTISEDGSGGGNVLTNDSDIENQPLTASITTNVSNGTLSLSSNGNYNYVPNANFNGTDNFTYQVCDNGSPALCDTETVTIIVTSVNDAPDTNSDLFTTTEDTQATGNVLTNDSDADGHTLSASVNTTTTNGTLTLQTNGNFTYMPNANYFGSDQFIYEVCDNGTPSICMTENVTISISPVNDAPTASGDNFTIVEDGSGSGNVLTNDSDIENQTLTATIITNVSNGTLTLNSNGTYNYVPNSNFNGTDNFTYQVCDNGSPALCDTETVVITVTSVNDAPITNSDLYTTKEDSLVSENVLTNDSDVDGNTLTASVNTTTSNGILVLQPNGDFTYTPNANYFGSDQFVYEVCDDGSPSICLTENVTISISPVNDAPTPNQDNYTIVEDATLTNNVLTNDSDIENHALAVTIISTVGNGSLTLNVSGDFTYVPNANYYGSDNFIYEVCDNGSPSLCVNEIVNIIINSVNDAPASMNDSFIGTEDTQVAGNVLSNDSDIDGNNLTATIQTQPLNGSISFLPNGSFTYNPNPNYFGSDAFTYEVCDDGTPILCEIATVNLAISPVNDPPIAIADNFSINEDNLLSNNVLSNDSEVENQPIASTVVVNPTNGTLSLNANGSFTYLPNTNFFGVDSFVYEVCDDSNPALCTQETATINVISVNDQPIVRNDTLTTDEGVQVAGNASTNDFDVETNPMAYTLLSFNNGSVLLNFDGSFYYTPFTGFSGVDSFQYRACDNGTPNYCETATVYINVIPDCVTLDISLNLEGPYDTQSGLMSTTLNTTRAVLPGMTNNPIPGQPYDVAPWLYYGNEGSNWTDADYDATVVDWVLISFRTGPEKSTEALRVAGILHSDGTVEFPETCISTQELSGNFYIVAEHRNHMAVMSPTQVSVVNRTLTWDFRTANSYTAGGNGAKQLTTGIWGLYAGDCNQLDDVVSYDINGKDKSSWLLDNGKFGTYLSTDINMNGDVNGSDKAMWLLNNGVFGSVKK